MTKPINFNLLQLAEHYHTHDVYGASVAYFASAENGLPALPADVCHISCHELLLIHKGTAHTTLHGMPTFLQPGDLLVLAPTRPIECRLQKETVCEGLLLDNATYTAARLRIDDYKTSLQGVPQTAHRVYHLTSEQADLLSGLFRQIRLTIRSPHTYESEMLTSLVHYVLLFLNGLSTREYHPIPDPRHKGNIFKIFMHLATKHFREKRQIQYYADKLCISTTYLSRVVKEISGNTVGEHLAHLTFNEACTLLADSDKTVGEIAYLLSFNDPPAFTHFFKQRTGISPAEYRKRHR